MTISTFCLRIPAILVFSLCFQSSLGVLQIRTRRKSSIKDFALTVQDWSADADALGPFGDGLFTKWVPATSPEYFTSTSVVSLAPDLTSAPQSFTCFHRLNRMSKLLPGNLRDDFWPDAINRIEIGVGIEPLEKNAPAAKLRDPTDAHTLALAVWDSTDETCQMKPMYILPFKPWTSAKDTDGIVQNPSGVQKTDDGIRLQVQYVDIVPEQRLYSFHIITTKDADIMPYVFQAEGTEIKEMQYIGEQSNNKQKKNKNGQDNDDDEKDDSLFKTWTFNDINTQDTKELPPPPKPPAKPKVMAKSKSIGYTSDHTTESTSRSSFSREDEGSGIFRNTFQEEVSTNVFDIFEMDRDSRQRKSGSIDPENSVVTKKVASFGTEESKYISYAEEINEIEEPKEKRKGKKGDWETDLFYWRRRLKVEQDKEIGDVYGYGISLVDRVMNLGQK